MQRTLLAFAFFSSGLIAQTTPAKPLAIDAARYSTLQAAFDAVPEVGGLVLIPPGDHEITEPLRISTGETRVAGSGASSHIINKSIDGKPAFIVEPRNLAENKKAQLWRIQIADVRISGNEKSGDGIFANRIQEIYLEGVSIDHHGGNGVHLHECFEDPRVADCIFTYNKASGLRIVNCHDIVVNANHFEENLDAVFCTDSFNLCFNGNNIDDHLRHGVVIENTYGSVLSGNMIEECNGTACILDRDCYGITISANVIAHHLEGGIDLRDAWGCAISANTFTIAHKFSVHVGQNSGRLTLSANNFCNTYIGGTNKRPVESATPMGIDEGTGILLSETRDVTISANTFSGLSTAAIWTEGVCERILATSNIATDCGQKLGKDTPYFDLRTAKNCVEKDNISTGEK